LPEKDIKFIENEGNQNLEDWDSLDKPKENNFRHHYSGQQQINPV
jgi:hypothetical protein